MIQTRPTIELNWDQYLELEKIAIGAFRPLKGFMTELEFRSVTSSMRLPNDEVFPLPVLLDVTKAIADSIKGEDKVSLIYSGEEVGCIRVKDIFQFNRQDAARKIFSTDDPKHPGFAHFLSLNPYFLGEEIELKTQIDSNFSGYELSPSQTLAEFQSREWTTIAGFQTRNVPHRAHEYLQRTALEMVDGLFIQPLVGRKQKGYFTPEAVIRGYSALVGSFLPADRVVTGILSTSMRYAGPREAVFHALIRRNYGCTHFIVGRDHAGVGDWYGTYDAHELTRQFDGDLGIEIMRLHGPFYCPDCDGIVTNKTCAHEDSGNTTSISGTDMRRILLNGESPNQKLMRPEIVEALRGTSLFIK